MDQATYNAAVVRRLYEEAMNRRQEALVDALVSPNVIVNSPSFAGPGRGRYLVKQGLVEQWQRTPDHQYTILDLIAGLIVAQWGIADVSGMVQQLRGA